MMTQTSRGEVEDGQVDERRVQIHIRDKILSSPKHNYP